MRKRNGGYDLVSSVLHTNMPVFVSTNRTTGWNDLIIENEAGDYRVLKFNGSVYPDAMDSPLTAWTDAVGYLSNPRLPMYGVSFLEESRTKNRDGAHVSAQSSNPWWVIRFQADRLNGNQRIFWLPRWTHFEL